MKKRLFAAFTALIMLLSVFAFASCEDESAEASSDVSAEESEKELTPRELFTASIFKTVADGVINTDNSVDDILNMLTGSTNAADGVGKLSLSVDKLNIEGATLDMFGGKASIEADIQFDKDTQISKIDYALDFMGEKPTGGVLYDNANKKMFITDLFDSLEKPILVNPANLEDSVDLGSFNSASPFDMDDVKYVFNSAVNAIGNNIKDDMFTSEVKDVTVDGNSYNGATVITLTVPKEASTAIAKEFIDSLLKNETIKSTLDADIEIEEEDFPESIKIVNTVVDKKSLALDVDIKLPEKTTANDESDEDEGPEYDTIAIHTSYVGDNFKLDFGPVDAEGKYFNEHGYISVSYTLDGENEKFIVGGMSDGEKVEIIKIEGTNKNGEHKGSAYFGTERDSLSFPYAFVENDNGGILVIGPFESNVSGEKEKLDLKISANLTTTDTKMSLNGTASFKEGTNEIAVSFTETLEQKDVTLEPITDYIEIDDFDESKLETAFKEKYPTLYQMIAGNNEDLVPYFIDERFVLYLPEGFEYEEDEIEGYTAVIYNDDVTIFVIEEKFEDIGVEFTLDNYISFLHACVGDNASEIFDDSLPYFVYENSEYGMHYFVTAYEGEDSFWLVQFCCSEDNFNDYQERFLEWAYDSGVVYFEVVDETDSF